MFIILSNWGNDIKRTLRFHLTPFRMATSTKQLTTNADIVVDKEEPHSLLVGMKIASATLGIIKECSENISHKCTV